ncbi:MAG: Lrp/AsnC ligand binding domain-containing protein [Flavobacteriaceae bacterium]
MNERVHALDATDLSILKALQEDARLTTVELARRVNLSPTPCAARMRALIDGGYITGFHAALDPHRLGRSLLVYLQVTLKNTDEPTLASFNGAIRALPEVLECHMVGGGFDYLVKLRVADMAAFRTFLGTVIGSMPAVAGTHSYFVMQEVRDAGMIPVPKAPGR